MSIQVQILSQEKATVLFNIKTIEKIAKIEYLDDNEVDSDISGKIQSAVSSLEAYLHRAVTRKQYLLEKSFERGEYLSIDLPNPTHKSIDEVQRWNGSDWDTLTSDRYTVTGLNQFTICFSKTWSTKTNETRYRVKYTSGWSVGDTGDNTLNISQQDHLRLNQAVAEMVASAYNGIIDTPVIDDRQRLALNDLKTPMIFG